MDYSPSEAPILVERNYWCRDEEDSHEALALKIAGKTTLTLKTFTVNP